MDIHTLLAFRDKIGEKLSVVDKYEEQGERGVLTELLNWVNMNIDDVQSKMEEEHERQKNT